MRGRNGHPDDRLCELRDHGNVEVRIVIAAEYREALALKLIERRDAKFGRRRKGLMTETVENALGTARG